MITEISDYFEEELPSQTSTATAQRRLYEAVFSCDLGDRTIVAEGLEPPVPVIAAFGKGI